MSNEYQTPWQILGLSEDADIAQVRRAYATRLKTVRPDEDPVAFQRLREARDSALRQIKFRAGTTNNDRVFSADVENVTYSVNAFLDPWSVDFDEPASIVLEDLETEEKPASRQPPLIEEPQPSMEDADLFPEQAVEGEQPKVSEIIQQIERRFSEDDLERRWDFDKWWGMLSQLGKLNFDERREIEFSLIRALPSSFVSNHKSIFTPQARKARAKVLALFNDEFGWLHQDRGIYRALDAEEADRLVGLLHRSQNDLASAFDLSHSPQDEIPFIHGQDLEAFFDPTEDQKSIAFYNRSYDAGTWQYSWHWGAFFFTELWAAYRGLWRHMFVLLVINTAGLALLLAGAASDNAVTGLIGAVIRLTTHSWSAFYARRWLVRAASRAVEAADALNIYNAGQRSDYLRKAAEKSGWKFIFVIFVFTTLLRLLMQLTIDKPQPRPRYTFPNYPKQLELLLPDEAGKDFKAQKCAPGDIQCNLRVLSELQRKIRELKEKRQKARELEKQQPKKPQEKPEN